jgi:hypothetical protein
MRNKSKSIKLFDKIILILNIAISIIIIYLIINQPQITYNFKYIAPINTFPIIPFIFTTILIFIITYNKKTNYTIKYIISIFPAFTLLLILIKSNNYIEQSLISLTWFAFQTFLLKKNYFNIYELYIYGILISIFILINPIFILLFISLYITISFKDILNIKKIISPILGFITMSILIYTIDYNFLNQYFFNNIKLSLLEWHFSQVSYKIIGIIAFALISCIAVYPWMQKQLVSIRRQTWIIILEIIIIMLLSTLLPLKNFENAILIYVWLLSMSLQNIIIKDELTWKRIIYQMMVVIISGYWVVMDKVVG